MREFDLDETLKRNRSLALRYRLGFRRQARSRQRDPEQWRVLLEMDRARLQKMAESGERVQVGPRTWELR